MKFLFTLLYIATATIITSCEDNDSSNVVINANNQFTAKMFTEVLSLKRDSFVMSAFSVLFPLAQLEMASEGDTRDELTKVLDIPHKMISDVISILIDRLKSIDKVELKCASKLYIDKSSGNELDDQFALVSRDVFESVPDIIDFSKEDAASLINQWVESQTNKRIQNLIHPDELRNAQLLLVNTLYFKGQWEHPFKSTNKNLFHVSTQGGVEVPMMKSEEFYQYGESSELNAKLLELPYVLHQASIIIILPNKIDGISEVEQKLSNPNILTKAITEMNGMTVLVKLPKFQIETEIDLDKVLKNMNLTKIFDPEKAKLTHLLKNGNKLYVQKAKQKVFIDVNESGSEAAAANSIKVLLGAPLFKPQPIEFNADHPFAFILKTGALTLFSGVYRGPGT